MYLDLPIPCLGCQGVDILSSYTIFCLHSSFCYLSVVFFLYFAVLNFRQSCTLIRLRPNNFFFFCSREHRLSKSDFSRYFALSLSDLYLFISLFHSRLPFTDSSNLFSHFCISLPHCFGLPFGFLAIFHPILLRSSLLSWFTISVFPKYLVFAGRLFCQVTSRPSALHRNVNSADAKCRSFSQT